MLFELPIVFHSQGTPLIGRVFRNTASLQERQPAIISMYISGAMDGRWNNDELNPAFRSLTAGDFEVVQLGWR